MKIFGMPIPFTGEKQKDMSAVPSGRGGWYPIIREPFTGAWQRNLEIRNDDASAFHADFACKTLIARDIGKLRSMGVVEAIARQYLCVESAR